MPISDLDAEEKKILRDCLRAAVEGPFFPDWEFGTLFSLRREEVRAILDSWPDLDEPNENVVLAINNTLNNLLGYPHGLHDNWSEFIPVDAAKVAQVFAKWKGRRVKNYFDGLM